MEEDTTFVPINDVYYRRLFIPILIAILLFVGCFAILRGSPGTPWIPNNQFQLGGYLKQLLPSK